MATSDQTLPDGDEWANSDDDETEDSVVNAEDKANDDKEKPKQKKQGKKTEKNNPEKAFENQDEFNEGKEKDYSLGSSRNADRMHGETGRDESGVADEGGLQKLLDTDEEDEEEEKKDEETEEDEERQAKEDQNKGKRRKPDSQSPTLNAAKKTKVDGPAAGSSTTPAPPEVASSSNSSTQRKISLKQTFQQLMDGEVTPETMEVMKVVFLNGEFWALTGNRRLFLFKHLEEMGVIQSIPVEVKDLSDKGVDREFRLRHTTENGGISVKIRKAEVRDELLPFINAAKRGRDNNGKEGKLNIGFEPHPVSKMLIGSLYENKKFGFIVMDSKGALFGTLCGKHREVLHKFSVDLPKKQERDEGSQWLVAIQRYFQQVADVAVELFITNDQPNIIGLVKAGTCDLKSELSQSFVLDMKLQMLVIKIIDVMSGGEDGFEEALEMAAVAIENVKSSREKKLLGEFFDELADEYGKCCFQVQETLKALEMGVVKSLLVWDNLDFVRYVLKNTATNEEKVIYLKPEQETDKTHFTDTETGIQLEVVESQSLLRWLANHYHGFGATLEIITDKSQEGVQFVKGFGGIGGILNHHVNFESMDSDDDDSMPPLTDDDY